MDLQRTNWILKSFYKENYDYSFIIKFYYIYQTMKGINTNFWMGIQKKRNFPIFLHVRIAFRLDYYKEIIKGENSPIAMNLDVRNF